MKIKGCVQFVVSLLLSARHRCSNSLSKFSNHFFVVFVIVIILEFFVKFIILNGIVKVLKGIVKVIVKIVRTILPRVFIYIYI